MITLSVEQDLLESLRVCVHHSVHEKALQHLKLQMELMICFFDSLHPVTLVCGSGTESMSESQTSHISLENVDNSVSYSHQRMHSRM